MMQPAPAPLETGKWRAIIGSLWSKALYVEIATRWQGVGFRYLLRLNAALITPALLLGIALFDQMLANPEASSHKAMWAAVEEICEQVPSMVWREGTMKSKAEQPHLIYLTNHEGKREPLAIVNEEGTLDELRDSTARLLLTADAVHLKTDDGIESHFWKDFEEEGNPSSEPFRLNATRALNHMKDLREWVLDHRGALYGWGGLSLWLTVMTIMSLYRMVQALIYGLATRAMASMFGMNMPYDVAVRLAAVALTPAILVHIALTLLVGSGISLLISMGITLGYLLMAILALRDDTAR